MNHYFKDSNNKENRYFNFYANLDDTEFKIRSSDNVFSKNSVDYGTRVLLRTIKDNYIEIKGEVLDFGCGYGIIGMYLKTIYPNISLCMSDITNIAIELTKHNLKDNNINDVDVIKSDLFENIIKKFNYIITNPPIKVGKHVLIKIINEGKEKLKDNGQLILVIKKKHGKDSIKKEMKNVFGNVDILKREKGYYVLKSVKDEI